MLDRNTSNCFTMSKQMSSSNLFKNKVTYKLFTQKSQTYTLPHTYIYTGFGIK